MPGALHDLQRASTRSPHADTWKWFALSREEKLGFFAGIWATWTSVCKLKEGSVTADMFGFLTTAPNGVVAPVHAKAMPDILTTETECQTWLTAPIDEALRLQRQHVLVACDHREGAELQPLGEVHGPDRDRALLHRQFVAQLGHARMGGTLS